MTPDDVRNMLRAEFARHIDRREIVVGVWVDSTSGWRWSSWTTPAEAPLGCDGEWGDEPTHFTEMLAPPPCPASSPVSEGEKL